MGKQAKIKQQHRAEAALENAMGVVDEALIDGGIGFHILTKILPQLDEFFLIYPNKIEGIKPIPGYTMETPEEMLEVLKRVVVGELETWLMGQDGNSLMCVRIPVNKVQAGGITLRDTWFMEIDPSKAPPA